MGKAPRCHGGSSVPWQHAGSMRLRLTLTLRLRLTLMLRLRLRLRLRHTLHEGVRP